MPSGGLNKGALREGVGPLPSHTRSLVPQGDFPLKRDRDLRDVNPPSQRKLRLRHGFNQSAPSLTVDKYAHKKTKAASKGGFVVFPRASVTAWRTALHAAPCASPPSSVPPRAHLASPARPW